MTSESVTDSTAASRKPWYRKWWGILLAICLWPYFIIWYAWGESRWNVAGKIAVTVIGSFGALVYIAAVSPNPKAGMTLATPSPTVAAVAKTSATPASPTPTPKPTYAHFGDGTQVVGKDVQPGTYRTRTASSGCYFERLSGFGGTLGETLDNDITDAPAIVTIAATDKGFKSSRCGTWTTDLSAITKSQTNFGDGMYIIGTDFRAGTYKSSGQSGCYYERLAGFTGSLSDTISNEITDAPAVITIAATDKGFKSSRCGTWAMQ